MAATNNGKAKQKASLAACISQKSVGITVKPDTKNENKAPAIQHEREVPHMNFHFNGFLVEAGPKIVVEDVITRIRQEYSETAKIKGHNRSIKIGEIGDYYTIAIGTSRKDNRFFKTDANATAIVQDALGDNSFFGVANYAILHKKTYRGIYTTCKDSMSIAHFFDFVTSEAKWAHKARVNEAYKKHGGKKNITEANKAEVDEQFLFYCRRMTTIEQIEAFLASIAEPTSLGYATTTMTMTQNELGMIEDMVTKEQVVLSFQRQKSSNQNWLGRIKQALDSIREFAKEKLSYIRIDGKDHLNKKTHFKTNNNRHGFGYYPMNNLIEKKTIDPANLLSKYSMDNMFKLLVEQAASQAQYFTMPEKKS